MDLKRLKTILKALGEDTRLRIVSLLSHENELKVQEISSVLGINQPTISKHLVKLRLLKIVSDKRAGKFVNYSLNINSEQGEIVSFLISKFSDVTVFKKDKEELHKL